MKTSGTAGRDPYAGGHGTSSIHVEHYDLDLTYRIIPNRLRGTATLTVVTTEAISEIVLDLAGLTVDKVTLTGGVLRRHVHRAGRLTLRLAEEAPASTRMTVTVHYGGNPKPVPSPWGPVGWDELEDGVLVASQPTGAPSWFPCNDRPDDKATYRTALTVDNPYRALAHGTLTSTRARASATTWVYEQRHPTSSYLATVQIGQYTEILLAEEPVPQRALVPARLASPTRRRLEQHGELMSFFVATFGPYPFETYTVVCTPDELEIPLEAQGISIFGANHLSAPEVEERLIAHELAHQWFGNSVSVTSWRHVWLNEGFACYAEWLWSEESGGDTTEAMARMWHARLADLPQDLVLADPGYAQIFDDRIYKRGALTLHALRHALGPRTFRGLVREWTTVFAHSSASTDDLRSLAERHSLAAGGADLAQSVTDVLDAWLDRPELPPFPGGSDER